MHIRNLSENTIKQRRQWVLYFIKRYKTITRDHIKSFTESLSEHRSPNTALSHLRNFIRFLERENKLPVGFSKYVHSVKTPKTLPKIIYSQKEIMLMLKFMPEANLTYIRYKCLFMFLYATGLRVSEARYLKLIDINLVDKSVFVRSGKGRKDRVVPLSSETVRLVRDYLSLKSDKSAYLFSSQGTAYSKGHIANMIRIYFPQGFTAHSFRHHLAVHLLQNGADIRHIQSLLGHADIRTTTIYTKLAQSDVKASYRRYHPRQILELE
jgi:integrase/recombinase XerD